jgi:hypothetical protein
MGSHPDWIRLFGRNVGPRATVRVCNKQSSLPRRCQRKQGGSGNPHGHGIMDEIVGNRHVAGQRDHAVIAPNLPPRSSSVLAMAIYAATRMRHEFTSRTTTSSSLSRHLVSSHLFAPIVLAGGRPHGILQIALLETRKNKIFPRRH